MPEFSIQEAYDVLVPLGVLVIELAVYSLFIFKFYRFLASRDIIKVDYSHYQNVGVRLIRWVFYILQNILLFPIIIFFWFAILAIFLGFLGRDQSTESILLVSIALVSAVRITAYFTEDLSRDLAKMLPFALLGVFLVDRSYFKLDVSLSLLRNIPDYWQLLVYYLVFIVALEIILRIIYDIVRLGRGKKGPPSTVPVETTKDVMVSSRDKNGILGG